MYDARISESNNVIMEDLIDDMYINNLDEKDEEQFSFEDIVIVERLDHPFEEE